MTQETSMFSRGWLCRCYICLRGGGTKFVPFLSWLASPWRNFSSRKRTFPRGDTMLHWICFGILWWKWKKIKATGWFAALVRVTNFKFGFLRLRGKMLFQKQPCLAGCRWFQVGNGNDLKSPPHRCTTEMLVEANQPNCHKPKMDLTVPYEIIYSLKCSCSYLKWPLIASLWIDGICPEAY